MTISHQEKWEIFPRDDNYDDDDDDDNDSGDHKNKHTTRGRSLFLSTNKTITIFAIASLLALTALTTLRAQESAPSGGTGGSPNQAKRLLVATETLSADTPQAGNNNNSPGIETGGSSPAAAAATRKLVDSGQQGGVSGGQASAPVKPTKSPALARSTSGELLLTRSTRQTKSSTRKHSTTAASGPDDDVAGPTTTPATLEPLSKGSQLADEQADQVEQQPSGKSAATGPASKAARDNKDKDKKRSQAKQRRGEEEEEAEETDEDEERDRERERARRRKLRNRLKTSTTTTTTTTSTTTSTTTRAPTSTTSSTTSSPIPLEPTQVTAIKNGAHQHHQNGSHNQPTSPAVAPKQSSNLPTAGQELTKLLPATTANGTTLKGPMGLGSVKLDDGAKVVKPNDGPMTSGDPSVQSTTAAPIIQGPTNQGDLMVGNKSLSELVRDTINEQTSNTVPKGLGDTMKHFKLICSVSTAPISATDIMDGSANGLKTVQNANESSNQAIGPFVTGDAQGQIANQTSLSPLLKSASHLIASNNSSLIGQDHSSNFSTTNEPSNNSTTLGGHDHGKLSTNSSASLLDAANRKSNNNSLNVVVVDNNHLPGSVAGLNSTINQGRRVDGKEVVKSTSSQTIERNKSVDHEKIEDHVKEQAESLRHFIVICSISVVVATSLIFAILTLLLK